MSKKTEGLAMSREEAMKHVASLLAVESHRHIKAAAQISRLRENTRQALAKNFEIARALGIEGEYRGRLTLYAE